MRQLRLLFHKNWLLYKRAPLANCLELSCPLFFCLILVLLNLISPLSTQTEQSWIGTSYSATVISNSDITALLKSCGEDKVGLVPKDDPLVNKIDTLLTNLGKTSTIFDSTAAFEAFLVDPAYGSPNAICFGITVESSTSGNYFYSLRFNMTTDSTTDGPWTTLSLSQDKDIDYALYSRTMTQGMVGAQNLVNTAILQIEENSSTEYIANTVAPIYQDNYSFNNIYYTIQEAIGIITLLPLSVIYLRQIYIMLMEKETKIRQTMYIMGMTGASYNFSWFVRYFAIYVILFIVVGVVLSSTLTYMSFGVVFVLGVSFGLCIMAQAFFVQVFTTKAKIGILTGLVLYVAQYVFSLLVTYSDNPTLLVSSLVSIAPHSAYILAYRTLLYCQSFSIQANFTQQINHYVIGYAVLSFLGHAVIFFIATWYLDQVIPNEWGAKRHPLFCCTEKTTAIMSKQEKELKKIQVKSQPGYSRKFQKIEERNRVQEEQDQSIEIVGLKKQFEGNKIPAVADLTVSMFEGQIFALLGHNGAGKTTTISMLSGMIEPTNGYLSVFGQTQTEKIRDQLGICPQHDTLYDDLTVQEHLELFGTFKGLEAHELNIEIERLITDVNLQEKRHEYSKNLSGGQKRKLSVAIAFAGKSKVIILDEPTSGMDTAARRYIWELLKSYKNDRVILLTTHFMDEADYLGDRIGIMGEGRMMCCGSSIFLKNNFGHGYSITFVKGSSDVSSNTIISVVKKHIPECEVLTNIVTDLIIQLPLGDVSKFPALFTELDDRKKQLGFSEYGIRISTLQEVFLNLANENEKNKNQDVEMKELEISNVVEKENKVNDEIGADSSSVYKLKSQENEQQQLLPQNFNFDYIPRVQSYFFRFILHFKATILKRLRVSRRDTKAFIFELLLPFLIILFALLLLKVSFQADFPARAITVDTYQTEQNPVLIPIASDSGAYLTAMSTAISGIYGSKVQVISDSSQNTVQLFDKNTLLPLRLSTKTLKGGIFFGSTPTISSGVTVYDFYTLVNTRTQESPFFLASIATEALLNNLGHSVNIQMTNYPMPRSEAQKSTNKGLSGFFGGCFMSLALSFKFTSTIAFIIRERINRSKHQMVVSGMNVKAYWVANFTFDFLLYMIVAILAILTAMGLQISSLIGDALPATWALFILYGLCYLPFTYIISFYLTEETSFFNLTWIGGGILPVILSVVRAITESSNPVARGLCWVFRLYPSFSFGQGMINLGSLSLYGQQQNGGVPLDPYDIQITVAPMIYLGIGAIASFGTLLLIEELNSNQQFMRFFLGKQKDVEQTEEITESDVLQEKEKALSVQAEKQYEILTQNLRKVYMIDGPTKHKVAVDNLSFGIRKGQVFGLLGVNGGGKTTTFKMLSGELTSTSGDCFINGLKISDNVDTVRQSLGYVPQFDAFVENLTVQEQMQLFYDLKGLEAEKKEEAIDSKINELNLQKYRDKISGTLSGGNKRKLSTALAMLGNPNVVFLDEPSTGMDPKARRYMWKVIGRVASDRKNVTVVLTTHSMEEAEALSSRLAIMVKGNFRCIGTPQHIKKKYGEGLQIEVKLQITQYDRLRQMMAQKGIKPGKIKKSELNDFMKKCEVGPNDRKRIVPDGDGSYIYFTFHSHGEVDAEILFEYFQICKKHEKMIDMLCNEVGIVEQLQRLQSFIRIKVLNAPEIGRMFKFFEYNKNKLNIEQYTIKEASVEQIFNQFADQDSPEPILRLTQLRRSVCNSIIR